MKTVNLQLTDVSRAFDGIPAKGRNLKFSGDVGDDGDPHSHLQGLAAYGDFFFLTQSDESRKSGRLLIVNRKQGIQKLVDEWSLPAVRTTPPFYNHPGGCQLVGDCLVIPVETGSGESVIQFFDVSDAPQIRELDISSRIFRKGRDAGAAGITSVTRNGVPSWLLCAYDNGAVDLYEPVNNTDISAGFRLLAAPPIPALKETEHQALCLLADGSDQVFAVGLNKTYTGRDTAVLYAVDLVNSRFDIVRERPFKATSPFLNSPHLRWGAGLELASGSELAMHCTGHDYRGGCDINGFDSRTIKRRSTTRSRPTKRKRSKMA